MSYSENYAADNYPIYAMRNFLVEQLSERDADELIDAYNEQTNRKKDRKFKFNQTKHPEIVTGGMCNAAGCSCHLCRPSKNRKGRTKERFNDTKFAMAAD